MSFLTWICCLTNIQMSLFPFDFDTFFQSDTECEMVVTNCQTGDAEYMTEKHDRRRLMDIGRASSSIPRCESLW